MPTYAYATLDQARQYLDQVKDSTDRDVVLRAQLARARGLIDAELRFRLWGVDVDTGAAEQSYPASATARVVRLAPTPLYLMLPPYLEGSITSIADSGGTTIPTAEWAEDWAAGAFTVRWSGNPASASVTSPGGWVDAAYTVTAKWGVGPAPAAVAEINLQLVVNLWRAKAKGGYSEIGGGQAGPVSTVVGALNGEQRRILARVRRDYQMVGSL